ncbi:MAG: penicillin-binding protein activator LpoB [Spirochaetes bacterium]|nr:penicillin-binding protein activator LpoB [Spirochaetota bacterium]
MKKHSKSIWAAALSICFAALTLGCGTNTPQTGGQFQSPAQQAAARAGLAELDSVIREISDSLNQNLEPGNILMFLYIQSSYPALSEYIVEELISNTVNDRVFSVVDRQQLDDIRAELDFQMSGEVSDESAQSIGRMLGAQIIVSGTVSRIGGVYSLRVRALDVETARIEGQFNRNVSETVIASLLQTPAPAAVAANVQPAAGPSPRAAQVAEPPITGILVPGDSLADQLAWLQRNVDSHNTYIIEVRADETVPPLTVGFPGTINVTIVLRGDNQNRTLRLSSNGTGLTINQNITFVLDNNITFHGHSGNNGRMVRVNSGGTFRMRTGSAIIGNGGGGVELAGGTFEMSGGTISGNSANTGGGVLVNVGTFTMSGGTIADNTANRGGGVGTSGAFTMSGGTISGNIARQAGGGVMLFMFSNFNKAGGIITGYANDPVYGNVVMDIAGNVLARSGHAVFLNNNTRRETTAGSGVNLAAGTGRPTSGAWAN